MKLHKIHIFTLAALTALAACEREAGDDELAADSAADTLGANADSMEMPSEPTVSGLDEVDDSGISGEATATHSAQEVTVSILLKEGAKADAEYQAHIHAGTCKDGGPVAVALEPVKNMQSSKTIQLSELPADKPAFIQVHDAAGKVVACGDMKGHEAGDIRARDTTRTSTY
ncbi:MAG TPA: hypothetical protein VFO52_05600 [Longimicrobiales bacterium]|nr:hypothetical protein [Longimicrobiales bacterium]